MARFRKAQTDGVWSATPTPFTPAMKVDKVAVKRLVKHHLRLGVKGLFLCGTCGEGPWMSVAQQRAFLQSVAAAAGGSLLLAMQVTANSPAQILENATRAREDGADIAVIAPPYFLMNATPDNIARHYIEAIRACPLPVGIYDRGTAGTVHVPDAVLKTIYAEKKVVMIKDSSCNPARRKIALAARKKRPSLVLLNGDEFNCVPYIEAGYNGLLLGGGIFNGCLAGQLIKAVRDGDMEEAERLQARQNRLQFDVYGGKKITCWLSGLKHLLVRMEVFRHAEGFLHYPLTASCKKAIERALKRDADVLLP